MGSKYGRTLRERLLSRLIIDQQTGCLIWTGTRNREGYGQLMPVGSNVPRGVHQWMYEMFVGPVSEGLELDHLCRVKHCAAPAHLEAVTHAENVRRGLTARAPRPPRSHCGAGHPMDEANTYHWRGWRQCRTCNRAAVARYAARKRVAS